MENFEDLLNRPRYYHMDGTPYTGTRMEQTLAWGRDLEDRKNNGGIIAQETLPNGIWVSTVWLGLDHNFGVGAPLIFESMAFETHGPLGPELAQLRWSTLEEAKAGHAALVKHYSHWKYKFILWFRRADRNLKKNFRFPFQP